jgi:superfamily I DNA and/or RNA helicase
VGDQKQLPATVFSDKNLRNGYNRSLFDRLTTLGHTYIMLDTQYRMLPILRITPSRLFYGSRLKDGDNVKQFDFCPPFLCGAIPFYMEESYSNDTAITSSHLDSIDRNHKLKSFVFFNVEGQDVQSFTTLSRSNSKEAKFCVTLIKLLQSESKKYKCDLGSIGVISPYNEQVQELKRTFREHGILMNGPGLAGE